MRRDELKDIGSHLLAIVTALALAAVVASGWPSAPPMAAGPAAVAEAAPEADAWAAAGGHR